uniref:Uncharacterized protein n=1 Tax=Nelumbo nucifera TaxID=4432 RepID=A0A822YUK6_NELNU|nr:TPA_asm: hypothetical protein HUJ06_011779 [Nelumbo nucifera]
MASPTPWLHKFSSYMPQSPPESDGAKYQQPPAPSPLQSSQTPATHSTLYRERERESILTLGL